MHRGKTQRPGITCDMSMFPKQDTPSGRAKHAGPFSEEAADRQGEKVEVPVSSSTPAQVARPRAPQNTPADGLIPLKEANLRSDTTNSDSGNEDAILLGDEQGKAESLVSSQSSAAIEGIRSTLVVLGREAESQARQCPS